MFDGKFRQSVDARTAPIGRWLVRAGFSADVLTGSGLVFACATAWAIAAGYFYLAIVLLTLTGAHDLFDGPVAKASHRASQRGSFFDSVIDRLSDAVLLGGVAYYLTAHHHGQLVLLPFAILTTTFLISYQRSKAESLGLSAKGGLMERAERMVLLGRGPARDADLHTGAVADAGAHHHDGDRPVLAGLADRRESRARDAVAESHSSTTRSRLRRGPSRASRH